MKDRETFLDKFNRAFVENDLNFIFDSVTDDVYWEMIGDKVIRGKEALIEMLNRVKQPHEMTLDLQAMVIDKNRAAVNGFMKMRDNNGLEKTYEFCDLYRFRPSEENKIEELRAFIIEVTTPTSKENNIPAV